VLAHRTSPTNLGLYLLSVVAAHDFGWLGTLDTVDRLEATLATMSGLERLRGHFYNWYDTQELRPLEPKYVSSVHSGNLAGHLIALGNAIREMVTAPLAAPQWFAGIDDAPEVARESLDELPDDRRTQTITRKHLAEGLDVLSRTVLASLESVTVVRLQAEREPGAENLVRPDQLTPAGRLAELALHADTVVDIAHTLSAERSDDAGADMLACVETVRASIRSHQRDLDRLMRWAKLLAVEAARDVAVNMVADASPARTLGRTFDSVPSLADLPNRCDDAVLILADRRAPRDRLRRVSRPLAS
jgi:cyclic beta-1,2-glucan glucanotransferase